MRVRQQKRWLQAVDRVGHAVWLMLLAAREAATDGDEGDDAGASAGSTQSGGAEDDGRSGEAGGERILERVRAVMLACSLLERSDTLRPRFRAAMSRAHTHPGWLWQLLGESLELDKLPRASPSQTVGNNANGGDADD